MYPNILLKSSSYRIWGDALAAGAGHYVLEPPRAIACFAGFLLSKTCSNPGFFTPSKPFAFQ